MMDGSELEEMDEWNVELSSDLSGFVLGENG
jgi:hypothetical protein